MKRVQFPIVFSCLLMIFTAVHADDTASNTKEARKPNEMASLIDAAIDAKLKEAGMKPAPTVSDEAFIRRASLDIRGVAPSAREVYEFVFEKKQTRAELIKAWLNDAGYAEHWADHWRRALIGSATTTRRFFAPLFSTWIEEQLKNNKPYDQIVRDIITAEGDMFSNGATNYTLRYESKAAGLAASTARHFMGVQIECAQCHDHPYNDYKQEDFWGMAGFFGRVNQTRRRNPNSAGNQPNAMTPEERRRQRQQGQGRRRKMSDSGSPAQNRVFKNVKRIFGVKERSQGVLKLDKNNDPVKPTDWGRSISPKFISKTSSKEPVTDNFRERYADFVIENKFFAETCVNRIWSLLFGRGLSNPVEDNEQRELLHPELLQTLAQEFVKSGHDLKWLIQSITLSNAYQRDSKRPDQQNDYARRLKVSGKIVSAERREQLAELAALERALFARAELRPLSPEQIFRSIIRSNDPNDNQKFRKAPGFRKLMRTVARQFTKVFDNEVEDIVEEYNGTIPQSLLMMNGKFIQQSIESDRGGLSNILKTFPEPKARVQWIFLNYVARPPTKKELKIFLGHVKKHKNSRESYEDVAWVLLNSSEFWFNS